MPVTGRSIKTHILWGSASAIALTAALAGAAVAQDAPVDEDDVIVVTATRRSESLQAVPLNIAAVTGAMIEEQGLEDLAQLSAWVPGISVNDQGGRGSDRVIVRGLNADPLGSAEAINNDGGGTVATYVGEIPVFIDLKLNDMERVEVLLGPQGTLYGAGTLGGAVRYIPNRPQFDENTLQLRGDVYNYSEGRDLSTDTGFTANLGLHEKLAMRISVDYLNDRGFIDYPFVVKEPGVSDPDPDFSDPERRLAPSLRRAHDRPRRALRVGAARGRAQRDDQRSVCARMDLRPRLRRARLGDRLLGVQRRRPARPERPAADA
jgi:outer membrane receptor protein involved in Fe transport